MIGGDNPLTMNVTASAAGPLPMLPAGSVRPVLEALERLGYDGPRLLATAGLQRERLQDPDALVPCVACSAMLDAAQRERSRPNLPFELAEITPLGAYPLIDYLVVSSATFGAGLTLVARYYRLLSPGAGLAIEAEDDEVRVRYCYQDPFFVEYGIALPLFHLQRQSQGAVWASAVHLVRSPGDLSAWQRAFRCPIVAGGEWNGFTLTREGWEAPSPRRDDALLGLLQRHAADVLARRPADEGLVSQVRRALEVGLTSGEATMEAIGRRLALAPRTLQRRLATEGTSFQSLLEETRRDAAARYLGESLLSIAEVSFALGYSEPAAFHRAFRRWQGLTPQEFRAQQRAS